MPPAGDGQVSVVGTTPPQPLMMVKVGNVTGRPTDEHVFGVDPVVVNVASAAAG